ncbi:MAG TPA: energy transducer TonB [Candidatus Kapabacteria bacterium]|jgi:protein TonB|nr:energy transducer TonB [Candidatus Kapabacteria bacterium]
MRPPLTVVMRTVAIATALFASLSIAASAQETTAEPDPDAVSEIDQPPTVDMEELASRIIYPEDARKAGLEGQVIIRVLLDEEGNPVEFRIDHSDADIFVDPAINAVTSMKFEPARKQGRPVECWISVPIKFKLVE